MIAVIDGKQKSAVDHPLRAALTRAENGMEPAAYGFVDLAALPPLPPDAAKAGLDGLKRIELQWGFQDDALVTLVRAVAPRLGGAYSRSSTSSPSISSRFLPSPPGSLPSVFSRSTWARPTTRSSRSTRNPTPQNAADVEAAENAFRQQFGLDLRSDLLEAPGPQARGLFPGARGSASRPTRWRR